MAISDRFQMTSHDMVPDADQAAGYSRLRTLCSTGSANVIDLAGSDRPVTACRLIWHGGPATEAPELAGSHALAMYSLIHSACGGSPVTLAQELESRGMAVTAGVTECSSFLEIRGPRYQSHGALRRVAEAVREGQGTESDFKAAKAAILDRLEVRGHALHLISADTFRATRFVPGSVLARSADGSPESVRDLPFSALAAIKTAMASPAAFDLVVVGDPDGMSYADDVSVLLGPHRADATTASKRVPALARPTGHVRVSSAFGSQPFLNWGTVIEADGWHDHLMLELAVEILGGMAGSRWYSLFHEQLGWTYATVASSVTYGFGARIFSLALVGMYIDPKALDRAVSVLLDEASSFAENGPTADEVNSTCLRLLRTEARCYDAVKDVANRATLYLHRGLGIDMAERRLDALRGVDRDWARERMRVLVRDATLVVVSTPGT
jgi:predicted Zn-dependent peptidase